MGKTLSELARFSEHLTLDVMSTAERLLETGQTEIEIRLPDMAGDWGVFTRDGIRMFLKHKGFELHQCAGRYWIRPWRTDLDWHRMAYQGIWDQRLLDEWTASQLSSCAP